MYDKILIPSDGSEGAEVAVDHAIELAKKFDSEIHVIFVVDKRASPGQEPASSPLTQFRKIGEDITEMISEEIQEENLTAVTEVTRGVPHEEITNYADENGIDLITMGTKGRTGLDRMLIGSTTEKVVRASNVPVMTISRD